MAPGGAGLSVSTVRASSSQVSIRDTVLLSAVSHRTTWACAAFAGYFDRTAGSLMTGHGHLESSDTRELEGIYYPE